jgi:hypothetical protein
MQETTWHSYAIAIFGSLCVIAGLAIKNHRPASVSADSHTEVQKGSEQPMATEVVELSPGSWDVIAWGLSATSPDSPEVKFAWARFQDEKGGIHVVPKCAYAIVSGEEGVKLNLYESGTWVLVIGEKELTNDPSLT